MLLSSGVLLLGWHQTWQSYATPKRSRVVKPANHRRLFCLLAICLPLGGCGRSNSGSSSGERPPAFSKEQPTFQQRVSSGRQVETIGGAQREVRADDWFVDVTARSGIDFCYRNGEEGQQFTILETVGGGVAMID